MSNESENKMRGKSAKFTAVGLILIMVLAGNTAFSEVYSDTSNYNTTNEGDSLIGTLEPIIIFRNETYIITEYIEVPTPYLVNNTVIEYVKVPIVINNTIVEYVEVPYYITQTELIPTYYNQTFYESVPYYVPVYHNTTLTELVYIKENQTLVQIDSDFDGVPDYVDAFPFDPTEVWDSDNDSFGNNRDAFPYDPAESSDADNDGIGDNADNCEGVRTWNLRDYDDDGLGDECDNDDDNDGVIDIRDRATGNFMSNLTVFMGVTLKNDGYNNIDEPYFWANWSEGSARSFEYTTENYQGNSTYVQHIDLGLVDLPDAMGSGLPMTVEGWEWDGANIAPNYLGTCDLVVPAIDECSASRMKVIVVDTDALINDPAVAQRVSTWVNNGEIVEPTSDSEWGVLSDFRDSFVEEMGSTISSQVLPSLVSWLVGLFFGVLV